MASLYNRQLLQQLTLQISGVEEPERVYPMPNFQFRLIAGGPSLAAKFRPSCVSLVLNEDSNLDWKAVLLLVRRIYTETENVIIKGKGGKDLLKTALDGSYISPVDTLAEVLKIIEEALKAANAGDNFNLAINFAAHKYWNKEISKYEFENFKKGSDPEEVEELIAKLLLEKKSIKYIQDPFLLEHRLSWHRLNLKLKEKGHSVHFSSRKYYNSMEEKKAFNADVTEADFPPSSR